jgi:hypothetical protein
MGLLGAKRWLVFTVVVKFTLLPIIAVERPLIFELPTRMLNYLGGGLARDDALEQLGFKVKLRFVFYLKDAAP